jgi:hypothetical protein
MGFILHPAPFLGWAGAGVDLEVRFLCWIVSRHRTCRRGFTREEGGAVHGTGFAGVRG